MSLFTPMKFLAVALTITPADAFFTTPMNYHVSIASRIIGAVIAVVVVLLLLLICYTLVPRLVPFSAHLVVEYGANPRDSAALGAASTSHGPRTRTTHFRTRARTTCTRAVPRPHQAQSTHPTIRCLRHTPAGSQGYSGRRQDRLRDSKAKGVTRRPPAPLRRLMSISFVGGFRA
ncbi:hypothetical protein DFH07DRAFT_824611 [Mycena maculata]|uniref:Uncharacterized protein n=1 Tax=Mycena maculata TaxID=230809 RepID=A0AAD7NAV9_9AGAR|nr:hypothetical protein DFH07DRAFT_824611 [Mycena maculata]